MVGWHHRLRGHEFEQAPREWYRTGKPGALQARKESDTTERLNSHKSTGNGRDLVGRQRPEMSAVPPPQPTGRRHSRISADRQLGRPPAQHTKARTQMQTARSLLTVGCGHSPRGPREVRAVQQATGTPADAPSTQSPRDAGAGCTPDPRAPACCESAHCCLLGPENHTGTSTGNRDVWDGGDKVSVNTTGELTRSTTNLTVDFTACSLKSQC